METPAYSWQLGGRRHHPSQPLLPGLDPLQHGFGGGDIEMRNAAARPSLGDTIGPHWELEGVGALCPLPNPTGVTLLLH